LVSPADPRGRGTAITKTTLASGATSPFSPSEPAHPNGGKIGGFLGCNWQGPSGFIWGLEGDGEWSNLIGSATYTNTGVPPDHFDSRIRSQASARGRLGYVWNNSLFYVTGGAAFANIKEHDVIDGSGPTTDTSATRTGWTVGVGADFVVWNNWFGRLEYRYADFGKFSYNPSVFPAFAENHKVSENAVRFGLGYKFGALPFLAGL
jgi:outer membrane immunogenic protein